MTMLLQTRHILRFACLLACLAGVLPAQAWVLNIAGGTRQLFLQVGNGTLNANVGTINLVSVSVPAAQLGNSTAQAMATNSTQSNSPWDNYNVCVPASGQVYVGGYYRRANNGQTATATLQVTSPTNLTTVAGDVIPFTSISWVSSSLGSATLDIPSGTFTGATQFLRTINANTYVENCHAFSYSNTAVRASGTYNGRVTYTLTSP